MNPSPRVSESKGGSSWLTRNVLSFGLSSFFSDLSHELVTALLPGFLLTLGAPPIGLGLIEGISNFGQSLAEFWGGREADRSSNRVPLMNAGYLATALKAAIALVPSWPWIIVIRTVAWLGRGARGPLRSAMIADEVDRHDWGKAYGFREALDTLGAVVGPLLAVLLLSRFHYRALIGLSIIPAAIAVVFVALMIREVPHRLSRPPSLDLRPADYSPMFRRFLLGATLFAVGYAAPTFFILRATQLLHSHGAVTAGMLAIGLYTVHNVFYALASFPTGSLADRMSPRYLLIAGYLLWTAVLWAFAAGPSNLALLGLLFIVSGMATALIETIQTTWGALLLAEESRGRGLGLLSALTGFGQFGSGLMLGLVWTQASAAPAFIISGVMALTGLLITQTIPPGSLAAQSGELGGGT
ncbi:MAG: MFS transporter [Chloroflexota bacterium]